LTAFFTAALDFLFFLASYRELLHASYHIRKLRQAVLIAAMPRVSWRVPAKCGRIVETYMPDLIDRPPPK
jgi:hypothetical protein